MDANTQWWKWVTWKHVWEKARLCLCCCYRTDWCWRPSVSQHVSSRFPPQFKSRDHEWRLSVLAGVVQKFVCCNLLQRKLIWSRTRLYVDNRPIGYRKCDCECELFHNCWIDSPSPHGVQFDLQCRRYHDRLQKLCESLLVPCFQFDCPAFWTKWTRHCAAKWTVKLISEIFLHIFLSVCFQWGIKFYNFGAQAAASLFTFADYTPNFIVSICKQQLCFLRWSCIQSAAGTFSSSHQRRLSEMTHHFAQSVQSEPNLINLESVLLNYVDFSTQYMTTKQCRLTEWLTSRWRKSLQTFCG